MKQQNTSHAVMAQRIEGATSLDDFPTPPWATRALIEHVLPSGNDLRAANCLEPACGRGYMAQTLAEYFGQVTAYDVCDYGYSGVADFLREPHPPQSFDWVITNPPFRLAEEFIARALPLSRQGVAMLTRTVFVESVGRYERLFRDRRPWKVAQFVERVPMVKGRIDKSASTATGYAWSVWTKVPTERTEISWIPPCRKTLERTSDYEQS